MCVNPIRLKTGMVIPCGKCIECMSAKRSSLSYECYRESLGNSLVHFVTLTYRNDMLPIASVETYLTSETSRHVYSEAFIKCRMGDLRKKLQNIMLVKDNNYTHCRPYVKKNNYTEDDKVEYQLVKTSLCPSCDIHDVQLSLKRSRRVIQRYNESHNSNYKLKYRLVSEYGTNSSRPHYHLLVYGIPTDLVYGIFSDWTDKFGNVDVRKVDKSNEVIIKTCNYLSKYTSKGSYDVDNVKNHYVITPRICTSKGFGLYSNDLQAEINYMRAYDLYGKYDIDTFELEDGEKLTDEQINHIVTEVFKRKRIKIGENSFVLSRKISSMYYSSIKPSKRYIDDFLGSEICNRSDYEIHYKYLYDKLENEKNEKNFNYFNRPGSAYSPCASSLQKMVTAISQSDFIKVYVAIKGEDFIGEEGHFNKDLSQTSSAILASLSSRERIKSDKYIKKLHESIF